VDRDGILELVFNTPDQDVYCFDGSTGALQFHYPRDGNGDIGGSYIISYVAIADVDNVDDKEELEIVVGSTEGYLDIIYYNGSSSYVRNRHNISGIVEDPAIGDVDGDGKAEIVVRSSIYGTKSSSGSSSGVVRINHVPVAINTSVDASELKARADFESSIVLVINGPDPDIVITASDISFDPAYPITSDNVAITVTVHNQKNDSFTNKPFRVSFYDGEAQIGEDLVVDSVPAEGAVDASVVWQYPGAGLHNIRVVVDAGCSVPEIDETNNEAETEINVHVYPIHNLNTGEGFFTIQDAIDDYNTQQGHTIIVGARTYTENVDVCGSG